MTGTIEHHPAERHAHTHGPGCGHDSVIHLRDDSGVQYDECTSCSCANCTDRRLAATTRW